MFLSSIKLWNFRKFGRAGAIDLKSPHLALILKNGLNVLIGENDSGKSAIIDAIRITLGTHSSEWSRITEDDFYSDSTRFRIELTFSDLSAPEGKNFVEWLTLHGKAPNLRPALCINYDVTRSGTRIIPSDIRAGAENDGHPLTAEAREYLKTTYLRPLRDAKTELVPKKNSRLAQILHGHELFKGKDADHDLKVLFDQFNAAVEEYFEAAVPGPGGVAKAAAGQKLKQEIDRYLASFYGEEKRSVINAAEGNLKSILEKLEISLRDEINPGLGTLNRLFMASELVHLNRSDWHGPRLCLIEELEAHLHPQAQMQVIEALQTEKGIQSILTTHSPNLASKVKLDSIIICNGGGAFPMGTDAEDKPLSELSPEDHQFLELFLDTTKANLFFARGVILVEGWSEELLLPALARAMKRAGLIKKDLTQSQVSVVNVGGTSHLRYAKIFARKAEPHLNIRVAVVTDVDVPVWEKTLQVDAEGKPVKDAANRNCYTFSKRDPATVDAETAAAQAALFAKYDQQSIKAFVAPCWTLEYSLRLSNALTVPFANALKKAHPHVDLANPESELAQKLLNRSLDKTELAHQLALALDTDAKLAAPTIVLAAHDPHLAYLIGAIKHACRD
jgi:putative ATP-dependent endonuclease of the OLD family